MNKQEKLAFLETGGALLRTDTNRKGEAIVKRRTLIKDWHLVLTFDSPIKASRFINRLANRLPDKFKIDQE